MHFNTLLHILSPHLLPVQIQHGKTQERKQQKKRNQMVEEEPLMVTQGRTPVYPSEVPQVGIGIIVR